MRPPDGRVEKGMRRESTANRMPGCKPAQIHQSRRRNLDNRIRGTTEGARFPMIPQMGFASMYPVRMVTHERRRFAIKFDRWYGLLSTALLMPPSDSAVEVQGLEVCVRMAWGFRARFPKSAVSSATQLSTHPTSRGVHGWAGRWLVNGSGQNIVSLSLAPPQRAFVMGFPVRLRELLVSVDDPAALVESLARRGL
jgi:hypothetical protein